MDNATLTIAEVQCSSIVLVLRIGERVQAREILIPPPKSAIGGQTMAELRDEESLRTKMATLDEERAIAKGQLDRERLKRVTNEVIDTITSPAFVEKMRQARTSADEGGGLDAAAKLLSLDGLREAGVDIPKDFRLTSRVFEDLAEGFTLKLDSKIPRRGDPDTLGWGACAGGGGLSFCGCGGFST